MTAHEEATAITTTQFYPPSAASDVAVTAKEQVGQVAGEARTQISSLTSQAREQVSEQATAQTRKAAGHARSFGEQLQALARGEATEGPAKDLVLDIGERVQRIADRLESKGPQDLLEDVRRYARNNPGAFLLGAMAAGFVGGRLMKAASSAGSQTGSPPYTMGGSVYRRPDPAHLGGERFASSSSVYPEEPGRTSGLGEAI